MEQNNNIVLNEQEQGAVMPFAFLLFFTLIFEA